MNRPTLKSACFLLLSFALGWGIGRLPEWRDGIGMEASQPLAEATQSGSETERVPVSEGSKKGVGTHEPEGKASEERVEKLVTRFINGVPDGDRAGFMSLMAEIAGLSAEEIGPVMESLAKKDRYRGDVNFLAVRWAMLDPKAAAAFAVKHEELMDGEVASSMLVELAKVDLPAARTALLQLREGAREYVGQQIVRLLLRDNPRAALAYARELGNGPAEGEALTQMAKEDPLAVAAELSPGKKEHESVAAAVALSLIARDRAAFESWMETLDDPAQRAAAREAALTNDAQAMPRQAALETAAWLAREPEAGARSERLVARIAENWWNGTEAPAEVAAWAAGLPEGQARNTAVGQVGRLWIGKNMMEASAWLGSLPQSEGRDNAVGYLVRKISKETPGDAFEWARTVESPLSRRLALRSALGDWARQDPAAARQAVDALTPWEQSDLRKVIEKAENEEKAKAQK